MSDLILERFPRSTGFVRAGMLWRVDTRDEFLREISGGYSIQSGVFGAINSKITTELNEYGQYEARIDSTDLTDDELRKLASVSAMTNIELNEDVLSERLFSDAIGVRHDELVGYHHGLYAGYVSQGDLRANGSSGGIATWILLQLLRRNFVDGVIHAQASTGNGKVLFEYSISTSEKEVLAGAKSRYYPLDLSEVLRAAKAGGGRYAVTGIPSFVTELRLLAEADPEFKRAIAFTVGLICGHQKSTKYADAIAWEQGIPPGSLVGVDFRKKIEGSSADEYITEMKVGSGENKLVVSRKADQVFVSSWSHGFFKSKFSDFTDDLFNETADIALGDAWLPQYSDDYRGTNLVIVRNRELAQILQEGLRDGELHLDELTPDEVIRSQPGLVRHAYDELPYRLSRADRRSEWRPRKRREASNEIGVLRRKIQDIREQIAEQSHLHFQKAVELDDWSYFVKKMKPLVDQHNALYSLTDTKRLFRKGPRHLLQKAYTEVLRRFRPTGN